jgi:hypothetical protein
VEWSLGISVSFTYGYLDQIADDEAMCTFMPLHESMRGSCLDELPRSPTLTDLRPYIDQVYTSPNVALSGDIFSTDSIISYILTFRDPSR